MGIMELGYYALNFIRAIFLKRYEPHNRGSAVLNIWTVKKFIPPTINRTLDLEEALKFACGSGHQSLASSRLQLAGGCSKIGAHTARGGCDLGPVVNGGRWRISEARVRAHGHTCSCMAGFSWGLFPAFIQRFCRSKCDWHQTTMDS